MATFRFELNGRPTKNKTYVVYLRVTVGGKRKLIKTMVEIARPSDFNAKCKGENWIRGGVRDAKVRIPDDIRSPFPVISVHTVDG